jgi:hypothetical protein
LIFVFEVALFSFSAKPFTFFWICERQQKNCRAMTELENYYYHLDRSNPSVQWKRILNSFIANFRGISLTNDELHNLCEAFKIKMQPKGKALVIPKLNTCLNFSQVVLPVSDQEYFDLLLDDCTRNNGTSQSQTSQESSRDPDEDAHVSWPGEENEQLIPSVPCHLQYSRVSYSPKISSVWCTPREILAVFDEESPAIFHSEVNPSNSPSN